MRDSILRLLSQCYRTLDRRAQLLVLTFHRAGDRSEISAGSVEEHLAFLARDYEVVLPSQLLSAGSSKRTAMITIDDSHDDVYRVIFPLAQRLGTPITICVPTDFFFSDKWLWFDKVKWAIGQVKTGCELAVADRKILVEAAKSPKQFSAYLKSQRPQERDRTINAVLPRMGLTAPDKPGAGFRPVAQSDMREMLASGLVEICSHSVTHPILALLPDDELEWEVTQSKRELEDFCQREAVSFCYPNGLAGDFDERTRRALIKAGYNVAFTSVEGLNRPGRCDLLELKRIHAHPRQAVLRRRASGLGDFQRRLGLSREG